MENSNLPGTEELAKTIMAMCDAPMVFRNLDVRRVMEN